MIKPDAKLYIREIPLECLQVKEHQERHASRLIHYVDLMRMYPGQYAGLIHVTPSDTHEGMYAILDGHHRYMASIMTGRDHALCVIVEDGA